MSQEEVTKPTQEPEAEVAGPSARTMQLWMIPLALILAGLTVASQLALPGLRQEGADPGLAIMGRALAGTVLVTVLILMYVLGWAELAQGWRHRSRSANVFFAIALLVTNLLGAVLLCLLDPYLRADLRRPERAER